MNLLAVFFKKLIALIIGAVGASLLLICINSAIEWHRGGNFPESEKKKLSWENEKLKKEHRQLAINIALEETKIKHIETSEDWRGVREGKIAYHYALKTKYEFERLKKESEILKINKALASDFEDCLARNSKNFFRYTIEIFFILLYYKISYNG